MNLKSNKLDKAAKQQSQFGPIFGDDDIIINSQPTLITESSSNLDNSFEFPSELSLTSDERDNLLAGSKYFLVDDMDAFYYEGKQRWSVLSRYENEMDPIRSYFYGLYLFPIKLFFLIGYINVCELRWKEQRIVIVGTIITFKRAL